MVLVVIVLSIPAVIYNILLMQGQFANLLSTGQIVYTQSQAVIAQVLQLPVYLGTVMILLYYTLSYQIKKATLK